MSRDAICVSHPQQVSSESESPSPHGFGLTLLDWHDYPQNPYSWANSVLVHLLAVTSVLLPFVIKVNLPPSQIPKDFGRDFGVIHLILPRFLPGPDDRTGGGGGGGDHSLLPASRGAIPRFAATQLAPPAAKIPNLAPVLPVEPTLLGPPELKLPAMSEYKNWGDPNGVLGELSNGIGTGGGIGNGHGTGVGPGDGPGYGPGEHGGWGGDSLSVGGEVLAPVPIYRPEPAYSEEARKAKYSGTVILWIVVDPQGNVRDIRLVKGVGMGLDEKAEEAVRTWKFKPGTRRGVPVPVRMTVEIAFRLF